ncbi:MAG: RNase adapter RapZ [Clostridia bacterium]|nr:RNase adapter RapZ [Clostridia bacterium]
MGKEQYLVIVTGLSGAGKTQAVRCLEDMGYFCVDNFPPDLVPRFLELLGQAEGTINRVALVIDVRGGRFFPSVFEALDFLHRQGIKYEVLFLDAADEILVRRFKETRRRHPLSPEGSVLEGIIEERHRLQELRSLASKIIDTSELTPQELRQQLQDLFAGTEATPLQVTLMSFGYKYGVPLDADLVMDVRFLPNPYYVKELRPFSGHDRCVEEYILRSPAAAQFLEMFITLLRFLLPYYVKEGKTHLVVAIGCTGGLHRSVTLTNKVAAALHGEGYRVTVRHRDLRREQPDNGRFLD